MIRNFAIPLVIGAVAYLAVGLANNDAKAGLLNDVIPSAEEACAGVSLTRALKYGDSEQNLVDVATISTSDPVPRPVLLFVAGESFTDEGTSGDRTMRDQAMC